MADTPQFPDPPPTGPHDDYGWRNGRPSKCEYVIPMGIAFDDLKKAAQELRSK